MENSHDQFVLVVAIYVEAVDVIDIIVVHIDAVDQDLRVNTYDSFLNDQVKIVYFN